MAGNGVEMTVEDLSSVLADFLRNNTVSKIEDRGKPGAKKLAITAPWGDTSVVIDLDENLDKLAAALNAVYLPERYSAIWHRDTKDLEIIFTAMPLGRELSDIPNRRFTFTHRGKDYRCEYGAASERLLTIAASARPIAQSVTQWRNFAVV